MRVIGGHTTGSERRWWQRREARRVGWVAKEGAPLALTVVRIVAERFIELR
jgi:hypothetical protein